MDSLQQYIEQYKKALSENNFPFAIGKLAMISHQLGTRQFPNETDREKFESLGRLLREITGDSEAAGPQAKAFAEKTVELFYNKDATGFDVAELRINYNGLKLESRINELMTSNKYSGRPGFDEVYSNQSKLEKFLLPNGWVDRFVGNARLGLWSEERTLWNKLAENSVSGRLDMKNLVQKYSAIGELTMQYIDTLTSEIFAPGILKEKEDHEKVIGEFTNLYKFMLSMPVAVGAQTPAKVAEVFDNTISANWSSYNDMMKQVILMEVSNRLAKEDWLGQDWKQYDAADVLVKKFKDMISSQRWFEGDKWERMTYQDSVKAFAGWAMKMFPEEFAHGMRNIAAGYVDEIASLYSGAKRWAGKSAGTLFNMMEVNEELKSHIGVLINQPIAREALVHGREYQRQQDLQSGKSRIPVSARLINMADEATFYGAHNFNEWINTGEIVVKMGPANTRRSDLETTRYDFSSTRVEDEMLDSWISNYHLLVVGPSHVALFDASQRDFAGDLEHSQFEVYLYNGNLGDVIARLRKHETSSGSRIALSEEKSRTKYHDSSMAYSFLPMSNESDIELLLLPRSYTIRNGIISKLGLDTINRSGEVRNMPYEDLGREFEFYASNKFHPNTEMTIRLLMPTV